MSDASVGVSSPRKHAASARLALRLADGAVATGLAFAVHAAAWSRSNGAAASIVALALAGAPPPLPLLSK
jgi:hypothetical protein